jgi:hypothetical protein
VSDTIWRKCSTCKKDIGLGSKYYVCSVSTCQSKITNYAFCSVPCWDAHLPIERHRSGNAGAIERKAPLQPEETSVRKILVAPSSGASSGSVETDVLVVVSKVRKYIHDRSGLNTSASAYDALTEKIQRLCDAAIETAKADGRKTVMDRDF